MALVKRSELNRPLTIEEMDGNFEYLEGISGSANKRELVFELLTEVQFPDLTSGVLTIGKTYVVSSFEFGDDFSNVGYVSEGVPFIATNTTPTAWVNNTVLYEIPSIIEYKIYKNDFEDLEFLIRIDSENVYPYIYITFSNFIGTHIPSQNINYDGFYDIQNSNILISLMVYDNGVIGTASTDYLI